MRTNDIFTTTYSPGSDPHRSLEVVLLLMNVIREHVTRTSVLGSETR